MVSLHPPLHCHHGADLCHTQLHRGPPIPQRKLKQVMSFYFQTRWWCWVHLMSMQLLCLHLPSFRDVATPKCHPKENLSAETLSCPIPQSMCIYLYTDKCTRNGAEAPEWEKLLWVKPQKQVTTFAYLTSHCMAYAHFSSWVVNLH